MKIWTFHKEYSFYSIIHNTTFRCVITQFGSNLGKEIWENDKLLSTSSIRPKDIIYQEEFLKKQQESGTICHLEFKDLVTLEENTTYNPMKPIKYNNKF